MSSASVLCFYDLPVPSVAAPGADKSDVPAVTPKAVDLSQAIATITGATKVYSEAKLPPSLPIPHGRWTPKRSEDAPHDVHGYWPMVLYH